MKKYLGEIISNIKEIVSRLPSKTITIIGYIFCFTFLLIGAFGFGMGVYGQNISQILVSLLFILPAILIYQKLIKHSAQTQTSGTTIKKPKSKTVAIVVAVVGIAMGAVRGNTDDVIEASTIPTSSPSASITRYVNETTATPMTATPSPTITSTPSPTPVFNIDECISETVAQYGDKSAYPYVVALNIKNNPDRNAVEFIAILRDDTTEDTAIKYADDLVRGFASNAALLDDTYEHPSNTSYGGIFQEHAFTIAVIQESKTKTQDEWWIAQGVAAGNNLTIQLQESYIAAKATPTPTVEPEETAQEIVSEESTETMVWLSATGSKYHSINDCGQMNPSKARQVPLSQAQKSYGKCSRCW